MPINWTDKLIAIEKIAQWEKLNATGTRWRLVADHPLNHIYPSLLRILRLYFLNEFSWSVFGRRGVLRCERKRSASVANVINCSSLQLFFGAPQVEGKRGKRC